MGWQGLNDIDDVEPLGDADKAVLDEVKSVLERHGALNRFGVTLLHSHFELGPDEVLVEQVDKSKRELVTRAIPERQATEEGELVPTSWRLDSSDGNPVAMTFCWRVRDFHAI